MTAADDESALLDTLAEDDGTIRGVIVPAGGSPAVRRDPEIPRLVGMTKAAELLGLARERVWQLINEDKLPAAKVGNMWVLREQVILEYKALQDHQRRQAVTDGE